MQRIFASPVAGFSLALSAVSSKFPTLSHMLKIKESNYLPRQQPSPPATEPGFVARGRGGLWSQRSEPGKGPTVYLTGNQPKLSPQMAEKSLSTAHVTSIPDQTTHRAHFWSSVAPLPFELATPNTHGLARSFYSSQRVNKNRTRSPTMK